MIRNPYGRRLDMLLKSPQDYTSGDSLGGV